MNTIIFLKFTPLTQKVYNDCCIGPLLSDGYSIEYWEVSALVGAHYSNFEHYDPNNQLVLRVLTRYEEFNNLVRQNVGALYVTLMSLNAKHIRFMRILSRYNCQLAFWGPFPTPYERRSTFERVKSISFNGVKSKLGQTLIKLCFKVNYLHPINYMFSAGNRGCLELNLGLHIESVLNKIKKYPINSSDYNNFRYKEQERIVLNDYIVFLDEYYPFHPDDELWGTKSYPSELYYNSLNKFLDAIEKHFGLEVVVAAHPKALRYKENNFFNGRKVIFNATGSLVKFSKMAITHDSTSMSFAVMNELPIVQLTSNWLEQNRADLVHSIQSFSKRLGLPVVNMDINTEDNISNLSLSLSQSQRALYSDFLYDYCTSPELKSSNEELVVGYVGQIFGTN